MSVYEFHGGLNDGLRMENYRPTSVVHLPMEIPIGNIQDYRDGEPAEGQRVGVYVYDGKPRPDADKVWEGNIRHMYLSKKLVLKNRCTCRPSWLTREVPDGLHRPECPCHREAPR